MYYNQKQYIKSASLQARYTLNHLQHISEKQELVISDLLEIGVTKESAYLKNFNLILAHLTLQYWLVYH